MDQLNPFLARHKENADFNQYWYSKATIGFLVSECEQFGNKFDQKFAKDPNFVFYDFNKPEDISKEFEKYFDMVVIDPPFITREVWEKYSEAAKFLVKDGGKILLSTIDENEPFIMELLGASKRAFRPSIPNLVYQYSLYSNYDSEGLNNKNPEIPEFD
ncbi:UNKNOWN [Stylonychia lemnae]|uniref:Uncharacterized protein n=1 Tax=Stylonychia lemnae TaxID=5949 RepID=A0A078A8L9_STYLE|nr:UNKNOWN [Stylonychia lemnae]|eukprot:CDW78226.1 UNKNOWN [Stylonychia lemnae]